ncbi:MAG: dsDNA nuclease domain-containing protein [Candidatus Thiodiazotropha sp.]
MDFLSSFADKPVRETSGSRSSNRFDYQKNWSLCELLELHAKKPDYLMVFEHHDDIVVFDSPENPSQAIFYQVKSKKSGHWTIGELTRKKSGSASIFAKLYQNHLEFKDNAHRLVFTSNQPLSAKLKNGDKSLDKARVTFCQLSDKEKQKVHSSVEPDSQNYCDLIGLNKIETEKCELRLEEHTIIAKGKLVEFFESLYPKEEINISLVYKTFFDEIRRKTNYEIQISGVSDLLKHKCVSRTDFEYMIGAVIKRTNDTALWSEASDTLNAEGYSFTEKRKIRSNWQQYIIAKMDASDELHIRFSEDVRAELKKVNIENNLMTFKDLAKATSGSLRKKYSKEYNDDYINAAILYEVLRNDPISSVDKKFTEEEK